MVRMATVVSGERGEVSPTLLMWLFILGSLIAFVAGFALKNDQIVALGFFLLVPAIVASAFVAKRHPKGLLNRIYEWLNRLLTEPD